MNKELIKKAFQLGYKHGMEKRADPPNAGLNDPNPLNRAIYKKWGYVAQTPRSYFYSKGMRRDAKKQDAFAGKFLGNKSDAQSLAAGVDFMRARGGLGSHYRPAGPRMVMVGSFPQSNPLAIAHEFGHAADHQNMLDSGKTTEDFESGYKSNPLPYEQRAWDLSGVPESDPVRRVALSTYEVGNKYRNMGLLPKSLAVLSGKIVRDSGRALKNFNSVSSKYNRGDTERAILEQSKKYPDVPIAHDYKSLLSIFSSDPPKIPVNGKAQ